MGRCIKKQALMAMLTLVTTFTSAQRYKELALNVDFQTFELDGHVHDMLWCGASDETILVQTDDGTVYRSRDRGQNWKRLKSLMQRQGQQVADVDQDIGKVHKIVQSPVDDQLIVFLGTSGINWISEDCGANISALNAGKKVQEFLFHPTQRAWALGASWTTCAEFVDEPCRIYKELYYTKNIGQEWIYITNYVFDFEWGQSKHAQTNGVKIPDDRIWVTRDDSNRGHQGTSKKISWSVSIDLYVSDDYWQTTPTEALKSGNTIIKTPQYMFVSCSFSDQLRVKIYSSTYRSGFLNLKQAHLPKDALLSASFTLMDTSEEQVFLYLENHGLRSPFGNLYISDANARSFSLSMENVIKGQAVDFERVTSLDGTFIANRYDDGSNHDFSKSKNLKKDFSEEDMIAEEERKNSKSRMGNSANQNAKQEETKRQVFKIEDSIPASEVQENVRTFITHNKGGRWELIRAPTETSKGEKISCYLEDQCSLHLEIYSHQGKLAPVYSTEKAIGLVLGTGNLGKRLTDNNSYKNMYLSRDGGLSWKSIKNGVYIYEIGDHGALIVIAKKGVPTNEVEFSWDEGDTWETLKVSEEKLYIENIIIEPNSVSQQFMVYGYYENDKSGGSVELQGTKGQRAFLTYLDFTNLHEPQCKGADNPGGQNSDYELWSPNDGRHGDSKCFLGQTVTYVRRKQSSLCFNGEDHEPIVKREPCTCTENDFECDIGYFRVDNGGTCTLVETENRTQEQIDHTNAKRQKEECEEFGYYEISSGYRKIPGNICYGGVDLSPARYQCNLSGKLFSVKGLFMFTVLAVVLYFGWPIIQTIIVLSPIPDPSDVKNRAASYIKSLKSKFAGTSSEQRPNACAYKSNFDDAPDILGEDSDDNDEEDIGRDFTKKKDLNYDSDEKEEADQTELISIETKTKEEAKAPAKKNVPKLKKPGTQP